MTDDEIQRLVHREKKKLNRSDVIIILLTGKPPEYIIYTKNNPDSSDIKYRIGRLVMKDNYIQLEQPKNIHIILMKKQKIILLKLTILF